MALTTPICKRYSKGFLLCAAALVSAFSAGSPSFASDADERDIERYVSARLAEFDDRGEDALKGYLGLFKSHADSPALADRLFDNAIRVGDMNAALRAARAQELRNQASSPVSMLLFADAVQRKDWRSAELAAIQFETRGNLGFVAPLLQSWVRVAKGKAHEFAIDNNNANGLLNYYSVDQRVYLELANGNYSGASKMLGQFAGDDSDFARDLMIRSAPVLSVNGFSDIAKRSLFQVVEQDYIAGLSSTQQSKMASTFSAVEGLAALNTRLSGALVEQNVSDQGLILARIAVWLDPASDAAKRNLARALIAEKNASGAEQIWASIDSKSPYWPRIVSEKFKHLSESGNSQSALNHAQKALEARPNSASLMLLLAQAYEGRKDYQSASQVYARLSGDAQKAGLKPTQQALYLLLWATSLDKAGNWQDAKRYLDDARLLDPNNAYILNYLSYSLSERGEDLGKALSYAKQAHRLAPDSAAIADSLGWAYYLNGEYDEAIKYLERAVMQSANDLDINEHVGDAYWKAGRRVDARYAWRTARHLADGEAAIRLSQKIDIGLAATAQNP